ncbi:sigma-70 family RNA polymerase sigma factor [Nocardia flavorosea]|uniref:Sigma-70 family RNA polymerase sigma factor n=1 Tax=Nocardia flavorosea TaxID=53429 RepID=A0A846YLL9_9NOCA|nr:sigma-70 family RNA polymerase sigma factor [Nocardia flavorosea]NKY58651.1 sigma-70 family RNA polymerase sigma factor [Nocardia flavorosea]
METVEKFEAARPRLLSLAYRIVGSHQDAEDAVQTAWTRVQVADLSEVAEPDAWFTTVTARLCLDLLRARERRGELPLLLDDIGGEQTGADEAFLRREDVSRALLVLLGELSPAQRVAYVLHDLFAVPFDRVATVLEATPAAAKKLASRARGRLRDARPPESGTATGHPSSSGYPDTAAHLEIVEAFLAAARGGDIARLVTLLAPDAVRIADPRLLPAGAPTEVRGATAVAEETRLFADRIAVTTTLLLAGSPAAVIAPGGHPFALIRFRIEDRLVRAIEIGQCMPGTISPS